MPITIAMLVGLLLLAALGDAGWLIMAIVLGGFLLGFEVKYRVGNYVILHPQYVEIAQDVWLSRRFPPKTRVAYSYIGALHIYPSGALEIHLFNESEGPSDPPNTITVHPEEASRLALDLQGRAASQRNGEVKIVFVDEDSA